MRYLFPLDLSTKTTTTTNYYHHQQNLFKKGGGDLLKCQNSWEWKGIGSGGEQEEIQSLNVSDMN